MNSDAVIEEVTRAYLLALFDTLAPTWFDPSEREGFIRDTLEQERPFITAALAAAGVQLSDAQWQPEPPADADAR